MGGVYVCACVHAYACAARNCGYTRVCRVSGVVKCARARALCV